MKKFAFIFVAAIAASFAVSMSSCGAAATTDSDSLMNEAVEAVEEVAEEAVEAVEAEAEEVVEEAAEAAVEAVQE